MMRAVLRFYALSQGLHPPEWSTCS